MTNIITTENNSSHRYSSREIAEWCEKQHTHVCRDIRAMLEGLEFNESKFGSVYKDAKNEDRKEYLLPKDLVMTLITGYRVDLRFKVIKRVEELESQPPQLNDPAFLRDTLLVYTERVLALESQVEEQQPMIEAFDRISNADGSLNITEAAKALQMRPKDLFSYLSQHGWIYKRAGSANWLGYQSKVLSGLMEHKVTTVLRGDGSEKVTEQVRITPKGLTKLAQLIKPAAVAA